jgi:hypothetical protein
VCGLGDIWAQTYQQQMQEQILGDVSAQNHQRQFREPACKNVSVQNHQEASGLAELMTDVRYNRRALARLCAQGAGDILAQTQPQQPRVLNLADFVVESGPDVGDVSAQNQQQWVLNGMMIFREAFEYHQVGLGHDQGLSKQHLCSVHAALDDLMHEVVLSCEIKVHDTVACGTSGLSDIASILQPTLLSPVGEDSKGTCRSCAFFRRGAFCHCCESGALLVGRRERRRKRLKERARAIENFMWFFIEGDAQDRSFGTKQGELQDFVDSPSGIVLVEIIGRDRIWALADWWCDAKDGGFGHVECMTMRHLTIELDTLSDFLRAFVNKSRRAWGPNFANWEVPPTKDMVMALGTHSCPTYPCKHFH